MGCMVVTSECDEKVKWPPVRRGTVRLTSSHTMVLRKELDRIIAIFGEIQEQKYPLQALKNEDFRGGRPLKRKRHCIRI
jgi:hypothetical protein